MTADSRRPRGDSARSRTDRLPPRHDLGGRGPWFLLSLAYTVLGGPLTSLTDRAAAELLERSPYIEAVLGR
nr:hypothetical protein [Streptomyces clavuligerus]